MLVGQKIMSLLALILHCDSYLMSYFPCGSLIRLIESPLTRSYSWKCMLKYPKKASPRKAQRKFKAVVEPIGVREWFLCSFERL